MALVDNAWYVDYGDGSTTGYYSVPVWAALTTYDAGTLRRQLAAPAVGSERVFVVVAGHVASGAAEPTWVITRGGKTTDATITWQECTGIAAINGDFSANTPTWTTVKNTAVTLGQVINDVARTIVLICTTAGTAGNGAEPSWAAYTTAGATTADNTATWTNIGVVGNFTGWQAPHARLANAFTATWGQAGNSLFVASEHVETQSTAMTLTSPGTAASPCFIYCVTKTAVPPVSANLTTGATITTTGNSSLTCTAHAYCYGIIYSAGNGANTVNFNIINSNGWWKFDTCAVRTGGTSGGVILVGTGNTDVMNKIEFINTTVQFASTASNINLRGGLFVWRNTASAITGATLPTTLFKATPASLSGIAQLIGIDLSALAAGKTIVGAITSPQSYLIMDCKLGSSVTVAATPTGPGGGETTVVRTDSSGTNYIEQKYAYAGTQTNETTIIRTGGATDGTTVESRKIVTTANSKWVLPFECIPITFWNDSTSAITTLTIYGTTTVGGVPKDDEIWMDVEYLGASGTPLGSFITTTKADNLAASAATSNSSDGSTWAGGGAGNGFKIVCPSFTPGQKGPITIYLKAAKASTTYYIDPKPSISGVTISKSYVTAPGVYSNELQSASTGTVFVIGS